MSAQHVAGRVPVQLSLRTPQVRFLSGLSKRAEVSISHALRRIIEASMANSPPEKMAASKRSRAHLFLPRNQVAFIDQLAVQWGVSRSEVMRRLIDQAADGNFTIWEDWQQAEPRGA